MRVTIKLTEEDVSHIIKTHLRSETGLYLEDTVIVFKVGTGGVTAELVYNDED